MSLGCLGEKRRSSQKVNLNDFVLTRKARLGQRIEASTVKDPKH